jgi:hypothetical protein
MADVLQADGGSGDQRQPWLTRYDVLALAIPGAVVLLVPYAQLSFAQFSHGAGSGPWQLLSTLQLGALGVLTIASFCAGQVLQGLAAFSSTLFRRFQPRSSQLELHQVPEYLRSDYARRLSVIGVRDVQGLTVGAFRAHVYGHVLAVVRRRGALGAIEDARVQYHVNRALAWAFLLLAAVSFPPFGTKLGTGWWPFAVYALLCTIMSLNAARLSRTFARDLRYAFIGLRPRRTAAVIPPPRT